MAKASRLTERQVEIRLRALRRDLESLPLTEQQWSDPTRSDDDRLRDRQAFYYEWDAQVMSFEELAEAFEVGALPPSQTELFRAVTAQLQDALPTLRRLRLSEPDATRFQRLLARLKPPLSA